MLKPNHLKQIIVLAEVGSINQAANVLHMTQPSLTNSIKKIEHQLGIPLFERTTKGVKPTLYTEHIIKKGKKILSDFDVLHKEIQLLASGQNGELHIGCGPVIIHTVIQEIITKFNVLYPNVEVNIHVDYPQKIVEKVKNGYFDIGFLNTEYIDIENNFKTLALHKENICFIANSSHPILLEEHICLSSILKYPLALPKIFIDNMGSLKINLSEANIKIRTCLTSNDYNLLLHTVRNTEAITAAPRHLFDRYKDSKDLVCLDYTDENLYWNAHALYDPIRMYSTSTKLFLDMIVDWFNQKK